MSLNDIQTAIRLIDASRQISRIYLRYGHVDAAQAELASLSKALQQRTNEKEVHGKSY